MWDDFGYVLVGVSIEWDDYSLEYCYIDILHLFF